MKQVFRHGLTTSRTADFLTAASIAALLALAGCAGSGDPGSGQASAPSSTETTATAQGEPAASGGKAPTAGSSTTPVTTTAGSDPTARAAKAPATSPATAESGWYAVINGEKAPVPPIPMGDTATVMRILEEGKNNNKVMEHLRHLTKEIGPRLTGSSAVEQANLWARDRFAAWGLDNPHIDSWGEIPVRFDRGPSTGKVLLRRERTLDNGDVEVTFDAIRDMQFSTLSWAAGTNGPVRAPVIKEPKTEEEYLAVKDKLKGAWILIEPASAVGQRGVRGGMTARYSMRKDAREKVANGTPIEQLPIEQRMVFDEPAGFISTTSDERVWTGAVPGWRELSMDAIPPDAHTVVRGSDYDFINSRIYDGVPIEIEFDLPHTLTPGPITVYNTVAEIRGTEKPEEVVIISAHLDSWNGPGSEGATDNGTGSAVTLEAARILMAAGAKPKRTIRFVLWTGEEQGLLGARGYVRKHEDQLPYISAVFVDDGGTNYQGGTPAADSMVPMLAAATAPVNGQFYSEVDGKFLDVNIRPTGNRIATHGSSDHAAFNQVGVPGFFWDEVGRADYSFGWHTQNDTYDLAIPEYLKQSATNSAIVAYRLACAPEMLPRVPQPTEEERNERRRQRPQGQRSE